MDLTGRIAFASTYFCDLVGVEHPAVRDMSFYDFVLREDIEFTKKIFDRFKVPNTDSFRFKLRRTDGTPIWADIQGEPMQAAGGQPYAISATVTAAENVRE